MRHASGYVDPVRVLLLSTSYTKYKISINTKEKQKEKQKNIEKQKKHDSYNVTVLYCTKFSIYYEFTSKTTMYADMTNYRIGPYWTASNLKLAPGTQNCPPRGSDEVRSTG